MLVFFAPLGVVLSYLVPCFQQCSWENIFKFWWVKALKLIMFSNLQGFFNPIGFSNLQGFCNPICNLGDFYWVDLDLSYSDTYISSTIVVISWRLISEDNGSIGWNSTMSLWKINFSLSKQQKEGSNDLVTQILRVVGRGSLLSLSHGLELFQKALRFHTIFFFQDKSSVGNTLPEKNGLNQNKQKRKKFFLPDYGRLECVPLPNHPYSHSSRSVPSISYM